jgi:hypothetical protein
MNMREPGTIPRVAPHPFPPLAFLLPYQTGAFGGGLGYPTHSDRWGPAQGTVDDFPVKWIADAWRAAAPIVSDDPP